MSTNISIKEASAQLKISDQRVRTLCRSGEIVAKKFGNAWLIDQESVDKYGLLTAHKIAENHDAYNIPKMTDERPIALSFFSGAMGLDLGIEKAGFNVRLVCEIDKYCRQTIALNRPDTALLGDINNYSAVDILRAAKLSYSDDIDLVIGGPPCQAFSTAGKRKGFDDDRGNVFLKYLELAFELNPKFIVIENVRGLLSSPMAHRPHDQRGDGFPDLSEDELKGGALNFILRILKKSGYGYSFNLYNSANFGTPQKRERVIIVCSRDGRVAPFLIPTHSETGEFGLQKWNNLRSCIANIPKHDHLNFPEKRLKYYRLLGPGQNWKDLPEDLQKEAMGKSYYAGGGKTGFLRRLSWNKPSPTLVTHPAMPATDLSHPEENRPLSVQEYKRIQEFPDSWEFAGAMIQQYKQIGNAVPASLGKAVGSLIIKMLREEEIQEYPNFKYSRYKYTDHEGWKNHFTLELKKNKQVFEQLELAFS